MPKSSVRNIYVLLYVVMSSALIMGMYFYSLRSGLDRLGETARVRIDQSSDRLLGQLVSFKQLSNILSRHPDIITAFNPATQLTSINSLLKSTALLSGSEQIFIVSRKGKVIASSNADTLISNIGEINPYEPYVQAALNGRLGYFGAIDKQTDARTIFIARGIYAGQSVPQGAVIIKVDIATLEYQWHVDDVALAFFDANDVAFVTNRPSMALRRIGRPGEPFSDLLHYAQYQVFNFFDHSKSTVFNHDIWKFYNTDELPKEALVFSQYIPRLEMTARVFMSTQSTKISSRVQAGLTAAILFALGMGLWSLWLRRQRLADRLAMEEAANIKLEARVEKRTEQLKRTQYQLVQAGKLKALGEMSAGISHELSQPLAAMKNFAENGTKMLDHNRFTDAQNNFGLISNQIDRATRIIKSLRAFARKEKETIEPVDLQTVINESLSLLNARCISENVSVVWQPSIDPVMVMGGHVRLQQVIINLLTNALDAMDNLNPKIIFINLSQSNNTVQMSLRDTGAGLVDPERVFEPFYTTKEIGASKGIGLGLSISYGIIGSFGGEMICKNHDQGGAKFTINLCKAPKQTTS